MSRKAQTQPARVTSYKRFKFVSHGQSHEFKLCRCYHQPISKCFYRLSGEFEIQLKPDAQPFALYTPRKVPYPL